MYPLSSRIDKKKNMVTMTGMKLRTLPTPSKIPSMTRPWIASLTPAAVIAASAASPRAPIPAASRSCRKAPMTLKVR